MSSNELKRWHRMHCHTWSPVASRISGWLSSIVSSSLVFSASSDSDSDSSPSSSSDPVELDRSTAIVPDVATFAVDFAATLPTSLFVPAALAPEAPELEDAGACTAAAGIEAAGARVLTETPERPSGGGRSLEQASGLAFFASSPCFGLASVAAPSPSAAVTAAEASSRPVPGRSARSSRP